MVFEGLLNEKQALISVGCVPFQTNQTGLLLLLFLSDLMPLSLPLSFQGNQPLDIATLIPLFSFQCVQPSD